MGAPRVCLARCLQSSDTSLWLSGTLGGAVFNHRKDAGFARALPSALAHTDTSHSQHTCTQAHTPLLLLSSPSVPDPTIFTRSFEVRVLLRHHRAAELLDVIGLTWPGFCSHWLRQRNLRLETQWDLCMVMEGHARLCKVMQGRASPQPGSGLSQLNQQSYCVPKTLIPSSVFQRPPVR